ncbi:hypothetical protein BG000_007942 [Podila horticola]|nr:hypothetical protein BG000_007942 [Podila horticola]
MESKLQHDLFNVLTVYAPNLSSLDVDKVHAVDSQHKLSWYGLRFPNMVLDTISSGGGDSGRSEAGMGEDASSISATKCMPGSKLKEIASKYYIRTQDAKQKGLVCVTDKGDLQRDRMKGIRVFVFGTKTFVRAEDNI